MAKLINCACGEVVRGDTDEELIAAATAHITRDHPDLLGKLSREDILNMSQEEGQAARQGKASD
jgi:predicted small metal-binding protein